MVVHYKCDDGFLEQDKDYIVLQTKDFGLGNIMVKLKGQKGWYNLKDFK
jgi:hypothetical protein